MSCRLATATSSSTRAGPPCPRCRFQRSNTRGRPQAEDVAQQHPVAPVAVESDRGRDRCLPPVPLAEAAAYGLQSLRDVQRSPGHRGLTPSDRMTRSPRSSSIARIAVDLLGGDDAPAVVVDGALRACDSDPDLHLLLVGPQTVADGFIAALAESDRHRVSVSVSESVVAMSDSPLRGVRRDTTVRAAAELVYAG